MIGECPSSLKVPSFLQNSIQIQKLPQPHISSAKTEKRVPKTPFLCVFSTLLTSDMFSYFPPKYNNFRLSQSTRNQVVAQAARGFESHPVRQRRTPKGVLFLYKEQGKSLKSILKPFLCPLFFLFFIPCKQFSQLLCPDFARRLR